MTKIALLVASEVSAEGENAVCAQVEGENVEGWYNPKTGRAYLYAPSLRDESLAKQVIFHEIVTHKGLKDLLGEERHKQLLDLVWESMDEADRRAQVEYVKQKELTDEEYAEAIDSLKTRRAAADEYMAHFAEKNMEQSAWSKIVAAIRQWLREHIDGLKDMEITEDDIRAYLQASYKNLKKEEEKTYVGDNEKSSLSAKIKGWLTDENLEWAEGRDFDEIKEKYGNNPEPIAVLPNIVKKNIPSLSDNYLYCGKAYFIDHHANHHMELGIEEYDNIQKILDDYDDIKDLSESGKFKIAFVKRIGKSYAVVVELSKENDKIMLHKTFFYKDDTGKRVPYKNKPSIKQKWSEDGSTSISPTENQQPADTENISALDSSSRGKGSEISQTEQEKTEKSAEGTENEGKTKGGVAKVKPLNLSKFAGKDTMKPALEGVFHDPEEKCAVASNSKILVWDKRQYDESHKGEIIESKSGKPINRQARWRRQEFQDRDGGFQGY